MKCCQPRRTMCDGVRCRFIPPRCATNAFSSIDRYRNSLPAAAGSTLSNPTAPNNWTIFVSFRGCLELCCSYLLFSNCRTVHFAGDSFAKFTFSAYTELPLRRSHCSAAVHCNSQLEPHTLNMTAQQ